MPKKMLYLNGGFDLGLAGAIPARLAALLPEMQLWYYALGDQGDLLVSDVEPPEPYRRYLDTLGLSGPGRAAEPIGQDACEPFPWGWDHGAEAVFARYGVQRTGPALETVRRVNGGLFARGLRQQLGLDVCGSEVCRDRAELQAVLRDRQTWPCVIKPEHGNAGIGMYIVDEPRAIDAAVAHSGQLLGSGNVPLRVETWYERTLDLSTRFELAESGTFSEPHHSRALVSSHGATYGIEWHRHDPALSPHLAALEAMSGSVAGSLHREQYHGPVNVDSMVAVVDGRPTLVPLVEINARQSMSSVVFGLCPRLGGADHVLLRTLGRSRHQLPETYADLSARLSADAYSPRTGEGIMLLTPLRLACADGPSQPHRSVFFVTAASAERLAELNLALSAAFARQT
jgi:hypothetical protein